MAELDHPFRTRKVTQRMGAEVVERDVVGKLIDDKRLRRARQHGLAAVREVAQPRGAIDRRSDVVSLAAQMYVAGVHADAQLDRCQRRSLQCECAANGVGGTGERDDEAVALALFDGPYPAMSSDRLGQGLIEAFRLRTSWPRAASPTGASNLRRRRAATSRFPSEARSYPGSSSLFRSWCQHAVTSIGETSAKSPISTTCARVHTHAGTADLGVLADGGASLPPNSECHD